MKLSGNIWLHRLMEARRCCSLNVITNTFNSAESSYRHHSAAYRHHSATYRHLQAPQRRLQALQRHLQAPTGNTAPPTGSRPLIMSVFTYHLAPTSFIPASFCNFVPKSIICHEIFLTAYKNGLVLHI